MRSVQDVTTSPPERAGPPSGAKRPRRILLVVIAALGAAAAVVGIVLALRGDEPAGRPTPAPPQALDPAAGELLSLVRAGRTVTFHARYRSSGPGVTIIVQTWRNRDLVRQDTEISSGGRTVQTAAFGLPEGTIACRREGGEAWTCSKVPGEAITSDALVAQITEELSGRSVTVRNETIAGREARCFSVVGGGQSSELCLARDGIPLLIATGDARLELDLLETSVAESVFRPPTTPS